MILVASCEEIEIWKRKNAAWECLNLDAAKTQTFLILLYRLMDAALANFAIQMVCILVTKILIRFFVHSLEKEFSCTQNTYVNSANHIKRIEMHASFSKMLKFCSK